MLVWNVKRLFRTSKRRILLSCIIAMAVFVFLDKLGSQANDEMVSKQQRRSLVYKNNSRPTFTTMKQVNTHATTPSVRTSTKKVDTHNCTEWFANSMEENLEVIKNYPRGNADEYLSNITHNPQTSGQLMTSSSQVETSFPVIVTAANSAFYKVTQGLLKSIHEILLPKYKDIKIIYYDMGLTESQRTQLLKYCKCEVRTFPFDKFPGHVKKLKTYTWKPLIVKMLLLEYKWVWWMDSSVRFTTDQLDEALSYSKINSMLFFTYGVVLSVAEQTDKQTMQYLGEDTCKFRHFGEVEATFLLFYSDHVTDIIVDQWAACAINEACMAPPGTSGKLGCSVRNKWDGRCHRFDQSVMGIILRRLFHEANDYPMTKHPFRIHVIKRGERVSYFPN